MAVHVEKYDLVITIILSIMIYRPFCKYICPLGAFYSVFNKVSVFRYRVDKEKCVHCGKCRNICQMEVDPAENPNSTECIRCGRCKRYVRHRQSGVGLQENPDTEKYENGTAYKI